LKLGLTSTDETPLRGLGDAPMTTNAERFSRSVEHAPMERGVSDETLPAERSAKMTGRVFGGYRLVTPLRSGGMGTVYYAEHTLIGRRAAVKILHPEVSRNPQVLARFLIEARAANDIRHPNVVEITDIGQSDDVHFIVMSFLDGETVGERLERNKILDEDVAVRIVRQVASALAAAHDHGIVHRDLKPENIFLLNHPDYPDYVKVLDFGIAKLIGPQGPNAVRNTMAGTVLGTPAYMSPEQCRPDSELDHRSDIYSLGIVLYEMLTGMVPFRFEAPPDVMLAHMRDKPVPPIDLNPKLSKHMNAAILRALEKDPAQRFGSMRELRNAIENAARPPAPTLPREAPNRHHPQAARKRQPARAGHAGHCGSMHATARRSQANFQEREQGDRQGSRASVPGTSSSQQRCLSKQVAGHHARGIHRSHGHRGTEAGNMPLLDVPGVFFQRRAHSSGLSRHLGAFAGGGTDREGNCRTA
jgi:serine/threonine protein kinase